MNASDLLADFAQRLGLPPITFSDEGTARVLVDGTLPIDWQHDAASQQLHLMVSFGPPPEGEEREAYLLRVLAANLLGRETGGAVFAFDPAAGDVVLTRTLSLEATDSLVLENALNGLLAAVETLREAFSAPAPAGQADGTQPASADGFLRA
jgi:hypothetical protein